MAGGLDAAERQVAEHALLLDRLPPPSVDAALLGRCRGPPAFLALPSEPVLAAWDQDQVEVVAVELVGQLIELAAADHHVAREVHQRRRRWSGRTFLDRQRRLGQVDLHRTVAAHVERDGLGRVLSFAGALFPASL